jgi:exosortase family protein XrtM
LVGRAILFVIIFGGLQLGWQMLEGTSLQHLLIDRGVVVPCAAVANRLSPGSSVQAVGNRLVQSRGSLRIVNGCDGMETLLLLVAGFAIAPLSLRTRLIGVMIGIPVVYVLNVARILTLLYAYRTDTELFEALHGIVTPAIMVLAIAVYYYLWLSVSGPRSVESAR